MTVRELLRKLSWDLADLEHPVVIRGAGGLNGIYCDLVEFIEEDERVLNSQVRDWYVGYYKHRFSRPDFSEVCLVIDLCEQ